MSTSSGEGSPRRAQKYRNYSFETGGQSRSGVSTASPALETPTAETHELENRVGVTPLSGGNNQPLT